MAKGVLEFDLSQPDEEQAFKRATKALDAYLALWDVTQEVFRPARKHGYSEEALQKALEGCDLVTTPDGCGAGTDLIERLEALFHEILREHGINLDEELS